MLIRSRRGPAGCASLPAGPGSVTSKAASCTYRECNQGTSRQNSTRVRSNPAAVDLDLEPFTSCS